MPQQLQQEHLQENIAYVIKYDLDTLKNYEIKVKLNLSNIKG